MLVNGRTHGASLNRDGQVCWLRHCAASDKVRHAMMAHFGVPLQTRYYGRLVIEISFCLR